MKINITNSYTEIYAGGGKWISQSAPKGKHDFWKTKMLDPLEDPADFMEVSDPEKEVLQKAEAERREPPQSFIDLFNRLCDYNTYPKGDRLYKEYLVFGKYDPENAPDALHPFYLNKLWLTYEEAIDVVNAHNITDSTTEYLCRARTLLPKRGYTTQSLYRYGSCIMGLESLYIANYYIINNLADPEVYQQNVSSTRELGQYSHKLRMILGKIRITADAMSTHFYSCNFPALEIFWVGGVFNSFTMNAPKLRVECWRYMIDNAANTTAITITVPSSIYVKLTGDTTAQEFTDLSEDEQTQWLEILDIAISRNISFATI